VTLAADAAKATAIDRISLSSLVNYGRTQINGVDTTTADQAWLRGRYDYNLSEKVFAFGGAGAETNRSAGTESRYSLTTGLG
jgi:putative salt-induced outer membrane protein YdiY